jgi:predicted AlkP superfamily pyrophosphatase or phosphodiesterase
MRLKWSAALIALSAVFLNAADPPKLAVLLVVDQMRADYVDRFQADWSAGLKRLVTKGAWFSRAAYPYLDTVTCTGHATIGTGAFPSTHGVFQNSWIDRERDTLITCTQDASVKAVSYGKPVAASESAVQLLIPTFAEEMHRQKGSRVVSLSLKARSAIMLAGHSGDAVTWLSDALDGWATSTAFTETPVPQVAAYVSANGIEADYGRTWERVLPGPRYLEPDDGLGEAPPLGWTVMFPHVLKGKAGDTVPGAAYYQQWERSPYADAYLGRMAAGLVDSMQLGKQGTTDVLAVGFSSPDLVGHLFGPRSQEVREMYAQLDRTIGILLDRLDAFLGPDQYVVALTSDHGVAPIPQQSKAEGHDAGRIDSLGLLQAIEKAAQKALGPGKYVGHLTSNDIYFHPGVFDQLIKNPSAIDAVMKAVKAQPGIARVFRGDELPAATASKDTLLLAAALSYAPGRSGDLIYAPKAGWMVGSTGTTHGSANPDDQRVPIIFYGQGIKPGKYTDAATPADIVPTLADICGITLPHAQGTALRSARN